MDEPGIIRPNSGYLLSVLVPAESDACVILVLCLEINPCNRYDASLYPQVQPGGGSPACAAVLLWPFGIPCSKLVMCGLSWMDDQVLCNIIQNPGPCNRGRRYYEDSTCHNLVDITCLRLAPAVPSVIESGLHEVEIKLYRSEFKSEKVSLVLVQSTFDSIPSTTPEKSHLPALTCQ